MPNQNPHDLPVYGQDGVDLSFLPGALLDSVWGHCSEVQVVTSIWGAPAHIRNGTMTLFVLFFPSIWVSWDAQTLQNKGKMPNDKSTLFYPPHDLALGLKISSEIADLKRATQQGLFSGAKKDPQNQKIARTAPKNFLNNSRGLPVITQQNKDFEANRTRKFTRTFGKIFVTQFLCGTFSVPNFLGGAILKVEIEIFIRDCFVQDSGPRQLMAPKVGCTRRGVVLCERTCFCLLSTF